MKKFKAVWVVLAALLLSVSGMLTACKKDDEEPEGPMISTYEATVTFDHQASGSSSNPLGAQNWNYSNWGVTVTFEVDNAGVIWNIETAAPQGRRYSVSSGWDAWQVYSGKWYVELLGTWTIKDVSEISMKKHDDGFPVIEEGGQGRIIFTHPTKEVPVVITHDLPCALIYLAVQKGISENNLV